MIIKVQKDISCSYLDGHVAEKPEAVVPGKGQVLCKVCNDIANGIHFGVTTCEGCKVRSVVVFLMVLQSNLLIRTGSAVKVSVFKVVEQLRL